MKTLAASLVLAAVVSIAHAENAWRWTDAGGALHYSNRPEAVPPDATAVTARLTLETDRLPAASDVDELSVRDAAEHHRIARVRPERPHRIYTEERRRFGCYASGVLFSGGWSHPDDITVVGNCLPYRLGPDAWLNAARAELALRQNGIDWRDVVDMWFAQPWPGMAHRVTDVSESD